MINTKTSAFMQLPAKMEIEKLNGIYLQVAILTGGCLIARSQAINHDSRVFIQLVTVRHTITILVNIICAIDAAE